MDLVDAVLDLGEGASSAAGQHMDRGSRKYLLQLPDRRDRCHEVADVIDLHHQDPLDVRVAEQRVPSEYRLYGFVVRTIIIRMARQAWAEIRIAGSEQRAPACFELVDIEHVRLTIAAGSLIVHQRGMWRVHNQLARPVRPQAEVQTVVDDFMRFLEAAECLIDTASHQHAGAGHRDDTALRQRQAKIAGGEGEGEGRGKGEGGGGGGRGEKGGGGGEEGGGKRGGWRRGWKGWGGGRDVVGEGDDEKGVGVGKEGGEKRGGGGGVRGGGGGMDFEEEWGEGGVEVGIMMVGCCRFRGWEGNVKDREE